MGVEKEIKKSIKSQKQIRITQRIKEELKI